MNLNDYQKLTKNYTERLQNLNKDVWEGCKTILRDAKSYDSPVPKEEIELFIALLEKSYQQSDIRKFDSLQDFITQGWLLTPIRYLSQASSKKLEKLTCPAISYFKMHTALWNKEKA